MAEGLMAEDYLEHAVAPFGQAEPGRVNGPAAMRQTAEWLLTQCPDLHMRIETIVAEGDTVAVRVFAEGTNLGPLTGVGTADGQAVRGSAEPLVPGRGRQAGRALATREDLVAMLQLGVVQPPARPAS